MHLKTLQPMTHIQTDALWLSLAVALSAAAIALPVALSLAVVLALRG